ncbi:MAG: hypothetical protein ACKO9B_07605 [Planctomycetota bacterium]
MSDLADTLHAFGRLFDRLGIPYAIMGGWAVRVYALPRPTYDVDFTVLVDRTRLPELYEAAEADGFTVPDQYRGGWVDAVADMPLVKFRLFQDGLGIDVDIFLAESDYQHELMRRRVQHTVAGTPAWFITVEDLILLKLIANRTRDRADIEDLLLASSELDEPYLRRWAVPLGIEAKLDEVLAARE